MDKVALNGYLGAVVLAGMAFWLYVELVWYWLDEGCSLVMCRSGNGYGAHTFVWVPLILAGFYFSYLRRDAVAGLLLVFFGGGMQELSWNMFAALVYQGGYFQTLGTYWSIAEFVGFLLVMVLVFLRSSKMRAMVDWRRYCVVLVLWAAFMVFWLSAGFHVTLYDGMTAFYPVVDVNLVEVEYHTVFIASFALCVKQKEKPKVEA